MEKLEFHTISRFSNSTRVDINVYQHGKCFIFLNYCGKKIIILLPSKFDLFYLQMFLVIVKFFIKAGAKVMKEIDKSRQKEIAQYISCLATVGEQVDICTDVAYRLTLWYSDQIQCLAEPSKFYMLALLVCEQFFYGILAINSLGSLALLQSRHIILRNALWKDELSKKYI